MRYRLLGSSATRVSELALGTMTFGERWGWGAPLEESRRILDLFLDRGGNFVDTACNYTDGESEEQLGELLEGRRERVVLATKYTLTAHPDDPNSGGNHRKSLRESVERSLRRLRTDYLDLLWMHMWDGLTPVRGVAGACEATPAQVCIAWVLAQRSRANLVPILGARTAAQLEENLAAIDLQLPPDQLQRLNEESAISLGFPSDFLADEEVVQLIFGRTRDLIAT